ncbi:interleukin-1 beta isoform X4 [Labeo rohita]|uniref:interleukin-1 beta isoform X3 n=1 Tax=Labeo rohita TaxID=84645 RepID=UPI0021E290E1|nr:interleukin-1 beta isoform X3 [Labeo rohita]XP_050977637.1 interleukin-1 beta isoform X4 [Labeo rohita]
MACNGYIDILVSECAHFDELDCPDPLAMSCQCNMFEDIELELLPHPHSMRQAVNIIIAVERMKHFKQMSSAKFCEEALIGALIFENVIEERQINPLNTPATYRKANQTLQCTICDKYKKSLVLSDELNTQDLHLKAVTLTGGNMNLKVRFSMSAYYTSTPQNIGQPVCLGISNSNLYLACTKSDDSSLPKLLLKEVSGPLNIINVGDSDEYDSLLFFRKETGTAYNTFESVKHPGWFISTAFEDTERVEMEKTPTDRTVNFTLEDQVKIRA